MASEIVFSKIGAFRGPCKKVLTQQTFPEELFSGPLQQFCVINHAEQFSENNLVGSYISSV